MSRALRAICEVGSYIQVDRPRALVLGSLMLQEADSMVVGVCTQVREISVAVYVV